MDCQWKPFIICSCLERVAFCFLARRQFVPARIWRHSWKTTAKTINCTAVLTAVLMPTSGLCDVDQSHCLNGLLCNVNQALAGMEPGQGMAWWDKGLPLMDWRMTIIIHWKQSSRTGHPWMPGTPLSPSATYYEMVKVTFENYYWKPFQSQHSLVICFNPVIC